jgi:hypothetical protein
MTWWDEAELTLLSTGNIELADQFGRWCHRVDEDCREMLRGEQGRTT